MIWATLGTLFYLFVLGGGGYAVGTVAGRLDYLIDQATSVVADPQRAASAAEEATAMRTAVEEFEHQILELRDQVSTLDAAPGTGIDDYMAVAHKIDKAWNEVEDELLDGVFELRASFTREEWEKVHADMRAMRK